MVISRNSLSNVICRATVCLGNMYFSATCIFWPKETAFRCTGENKAFWVNATWLKHTLFEKKLMAFVWLWARPDFLHFYLDLLVISHVTTILLEYCAWRWREGIYTWKQENTLTLLLATHCIRETEAQRLTQAVRKSGREPRCRDVWGYILSMGTYSSIIWEIHEKGRLRKTEELWFLLLLQFWLTSSSN